MNKIFWLKMVLMLMCCAYGHGQSSKVAELDNTLLKLSFDKQTKTWNLFENESGEWLRVISAATASMSFHDGDSLLLTEETSEVISKVQPFSDAIGKGRMLDLKVRGLKAEWKMSFVVYDAQKLVTLSASIKNISSGDWKPAAFHLLDIHGAGSLAFSTSNVLMHINGYQSWSTSEIVLLDSLHRNISYWSTVFSEPQAYRSVLFGFLTDTVAMNSFTTQPFDFEQNQLHCSSTSDLKTLTVASGREIQSDRLMIAFDSSPLENLKTFGRHLQLFAPTINKPFTPTGRNSLSTMGKEDIPTGWCSWYYYYQHISEDSILVNLNAAEKYLKDAGLHYIQIDDGYQIAAGDWRMNKKFPHGHKWLVDTIHKKGFLAGLWIAPFAVTESSSVYKHHRDWLLKGEGDTLKEFFANDWWGGRIFSLDPTHPEAQRWLSDLLYTITNDWGYDYVKIDFLYFAGEGGKYHQNVTSAQAYRMGLQAIRRGAGSEKFILGCGAPIGSSIGYVDGMRIGQDVYAGWNGITPGVNAASQRYFYNNTVWFNDPDCLVARDPLTIDQARAWASIVALSGQMNIMSDKLSTLPQERIALLQKTLPVYGTPATPVDLFSVPKEQGLTLRSADGTTTFALSHRWKFAVGDSILWKEPTFRDDEWKEISVPSRWEDVGYPGVDGFVWYRLTFTLPPGLQKSPLTLMLGKIDDCDETYLNGTLVGKTGTMPPDYNSEWPSFRSYVIPDQLIHWEGENTFAIRVYDGGGLGGFYSIKQLTLPTVWTLHVEKPFDRWQVAGIFNWTNLSTTLSLTKAQLGLPVKKSYLLYESWQGQYLGELRDSLQLTLEPTSSAILSIHEKGTQPIILSTSRHIVNGAIDLFDEQWDAKQQTLSVNSHNLLTGSYEVVVYVPEGMQVAGVSAPVASTVRIDNGIARIEFPNLRKSSFAWKVKFQ
jgi:hypothetical protein